MEKFKISPEEFRKILAGIDLKTISLQKSSVYLNPEIKVPQNLYSKINEDADFKIRENDIVNLFQTYSLDARQPKSKSRYIQIEVTFIVRVSSEFEFTQDFFDVYKSASLHLNTWPYFREFVNQATARMNVPPLTLPFFKTK